MRIFTFVSFLLISIINLNAQNPFITITETQADQGTMVDIEFRVDNFTDLISFQTPIRWNKDVIRLVGASELAALPNYNENDNFGIDEGIETGMMIAFWESPGFTPRSLPDNTILYTLTFEVIGAPGQSTVIEIFDDINNNPDFVNSEFESIDFGQSPGSVEVSGMASTLTMTLGDVEVSASGNTCVPINANSFINVGIFQYAVTWDPSFMSLEDIVGNIPNFGPGDFSIDNANGRAFISYVNINGLTLPSGELVMELCFNVTGSSGCSDVDFASFPGDDFEIQFGTPSGDDIPFVMNNGSVCHGGDPVECEPDGFTFIFDEVRAEPGEILCYPIKVANFTNVLSMQFCLQWDPSVISYIAPPTEFFLPGLSEFNFNNVEPGLMAFVWDAADPVTFDDFNPIFSLCFEVIGELGESSPFTMDGNCLDGGIEISFDDREPILSLDDIFFCEGGIVVSDEISIDITLEQILNVTCPNDTDGGIAVDVTGGNGDYTFSWERISTGGGNVGSSRNLTNVGPGEYILIVEDSDGNMAQAGPFTIESEFTITVDETLNSPTCKNGEDGSISLNISGNTGTVTNINWMPGPSGSDLIDLTDISAGSYTVEIAFGDGCVITKGIELEDGPGPEVNADVDANSGNIDLTVSGGESPYTFEWSDGNTDEDRSGLSDGVYTVTVTDQNGCSTEAGPFNIGEGELNLEIIVSDYNGFGVSCHSACDGNIMVIPLFGTPPYSYEWSDDNTEPDRDELCAGSYTITVTDSEGQSAEETITIASPERLRIQVVDYTQSTMDNGSATVTVTGGAPPISYQWNDPASTTGPTIVNQPAEPRTIVATDANGCTVERTINFADAPTDECYENRLVITPNGDGLNDELFITCLSGVPNDIHIFNRYGKMVFSAQNYDNTWMGTEQDGTPLPDGGYFFVLRVRQSGEPERVVKNSFTILRNVR